ncbi:MAG: tryptophan synthase subunit alpha [Chitinophagaceae bacterium]|nr:MAG: tryptophan synthase subunit alpha [Chitinophagaceae bacterium]
MNRITQLFENKKSRVLNVYCTAGYPKVDSTLEVLRALQDAGADMIEIGMPYSDPLADGQVIQSSSAKAIENGMTMSRLFDDLKSFRKDIRVPVILMGYMNPVMQFGFENFCRNAQETGVDGLILPDLPIYEFETEYGKLINKYGLKFIFLVTPETSPERISKLDSLSTGFLYAVSSSSTTGNEKSMDSQMDYFKRLKDMNLKNPVLIGFGIKDKATFDAATKYSNGAIIGTAYIRALDKMGSISSTTKDFIDGVIG